MQKYLQLSNLERSAAEGNNHKNQPKTTIMLFLFYIPYRGTRILQNMDKVDIPDPNYRFTIQTTTKDCYIYIKKIHRRVILLLRQVDDFCTGCTDEQDAKNI